MLATTVHRLQVVDDPLPEAIHDFRVDLIATRDEAIWCAEPHRPPGILWDHLHQDKIAKALRRARNRPGGYWVAAADPQAASQAVTGTLPGKSLQRAVLLSDGVSRLVDLFELATWEKLLALLDESGPEELLRQVRAAEAVDAEGRQWPRTKRSDDATAVYLVRS